MLSILLINDFEVKCDERTNERTKNERTDRTHTHIVSFISTDAKSGAIESKSNADFVSLYLMFHIVCFNILLVLLNIEKCINK